MSLSKKMFLFLLAVVVGLSAFFYVVFQIVIVNDLKEIEAKTIANNVERAKASIADEIEGLKGRVGDYALWDATHDYLAGSNPQYTSKDIYTANFANLEINMIALFNLDKSLNYARAYDYSNENDITINPADKQFLSNLLAKKGQANGNGIFKFQDKIMLASWQSVLHNDGSGPSNGYIMMGRFIDGDLIQKVSSEVMNEVEVLPFDEAADNSDYRNVIIALDKGEATYSQLQGNRFISYSYLNDINDEPVGVIRIADDRVIYERATIDANLLLLIFIIVFLSVGFGVYLYFEKKVLGRIEALTVFIEDNIKDQNYTAKIKVTGKDEISKLQEAFNILIDEIGRVCKL